MEEYLIPMAWSAVYILETFLLLWLAKFAYVSLYRRVDLKREIFDRRNYALATATTGYLFGVIVAFGGVLAGPSAGWKADLLGIALYGIVSIALLLVASFLSEKVLLPHFDNTREVVQDRNMGTAFVEAGMHIANGLIILAIVQGDGPWWIGLVFWGLAQIILILVALLYEVSTRHSIHAELERDNAAVGLAFCGALVGMGNIISLAVAGDFLGWKASLLGFGSYAIFGLLMLQIVKRLTDMLLAPGVKLGKEQSDDQPSVGAGLFEAFGYVGASMLLVWAL